MGAQLVDGVTASGSAGVPAESPPTPPSVSHRFIHAVVTTRPRVIAAWVALALGFMMFFLQGDILYNSFVANQVARGHLDVYSFFSSRSHFAGIDTVMPPLYYLVTGLYLKLLMLVHLDPTAYNPQFLFTNVFHTHMGFVLMLGLVLLKLPNLIAIVAGLLAAWRITQNMPDTDRKLVIFLWLASPALIVSALMQAQNDALAAAITLASLVAYQRGKLDWMFLILGFAACFKTYALVLVPPTAILLANRDLTKIVRYGIISALPLALVSIPFLGGSYLHRVFGAHDGNTLLSASYNGRLPVHLWALGYLVVIGVAWIISRRKTDIFDVVSVWFLPLCLMFILNWWVPQWAVWLLPAVILLAARDRVFAWLWVATNLAVFTDNLLNYPGNMDGGMLEPFYGDPNHPANSHFYNFHLFHIWQHVPYAALDSAYIVCGALFLCLFIRALQWALARSQIELSERTLPRLPDVYGAALAGPLLLVPYIGIMIVQRLVG
jgi:hypothetical protein